MSPASFGQIETSEMVVHTLAAIDVEHNGPCYSVPALCESMIRQGVETTLAGC